jgi:hypothetical protein
MTSATFEGKITCEGRPVEDAQVRILGSIETLGADPRAASYDPTAITWSRPISGYEGNAWNAWQKYVVREVAGITWEEFKEEVSRYNPSLRDTEGQFEAERTYLLPQIQVYEEVRDLRPQFIWDWQVTGIEGDRWACWKCYVRTKVADMTWGDFKAEVGAQNPYLIEDGYQFAADKAYLLPRDAGVEQYNRVTYTDAQGKFLFVDLPPGAYQVQVLAEGCQAWVRDLDFSTDLARDVRLETLSRAAPRAADPFVRVDGDQFIVNGEKFRFIGVNLRGLAHYGNDTFNKWENRPAQKEDQHKQLAEARRMGARVVRLFLAARDAPPQEVGERLTGVLKVLESDNLLQDMYLILCFTDIYKNTPFHPQGDDDFYESQHGWELLNRAWFEGGYTKNYLPFVEHIVRTFHHHPQIFAWEIGNELKLMTGPQYRRLFIKFNHDVANHIAQIDPSNHLITTGLLSTRHADLGTPGALQLYSSPHISFVTNHIYNGGFDYTAGCRVGDKIGHGDDSSVAQHPSIRKPLIVEEAGYDAERQSPARGQDAAEDMRRWFDEKGARGYMQWAFMSGGNIGDGDSCRGMDQALHTDWDSLYTAYKDRARNLGTLGPF